MLYVVGVDVRHVIGVCAAHSVDGFHEALAGQVLGVGGVSLVATESAEDVYAAVYAERGVEHRAVGIGGAAHGRHILHALALGALHEDVAHGGPAGAYLGVEFLNGIL